MATQSAESLARTAFGKDLKKIRVRQGLTMTTAARHAGISLGTWSRYEQGITRPGIDKAPRIAKGLGVPIAALFPHTDESSIVIAELRLSHTTISELRRQGDSYKETLSLRLAKTLEPTLNALATRPRKLPAIQATPRQRDLRVHPELVRSSMNRRADPFLASH